MKRKLIYLGIVIVVALVVLIIERPDLNLQGDADFEPLISDYDLDGVTQIKIDQLVSGVQVKKDGDTWMVADMTTSLREQLGKQGSGQPKETVWYPADTAVVKRALRALANVQKGIVASMNPDNQVAYQVGGLIGLHVVLGKENGTVADVIIGKTSPDHSGSYVRNQGSDEVFLVNKTLAGLFPTALTDWRDRTIWNVEPEKVKSISVVTPRNSYEIVKDEDVWAVRGKPDATLDKVMMSELLGRLSDMRARGFAAQGDPRAAFKKPALTVELALDSGEAKILEVAGVNNLGQAYARRKGDDQVYLVGSPDSLVPADWNKLKKK